MKGRPSYSTVSAKRVMRAAHAVPAAQRPHVLVCGPTAFVEAVSRGLLDLGHDPNRIKTERYGGMGETP